MHTFSCTRAKREFRQILNLAEQNQPVLITRYGKPIAIMIPAQDTSLDSLQSYLEAFETHHKKQKLMSFAGAGSSLVNPSDPDETVQQLREHRDEF